MSQNNLIIIVLSCLRITCFATEMITVIDGPIHECTLTFPYGPLPQKAVEKTPPKPIFEDIPFQLETYSVWIHGYWAWNEQKNDYIWITGTWRKPPPEHHWIHGFWKKFEQGWVWISGFWSKPYFDSITFIENSPPEYVNENPGTPPKEKSFWMPGYWHYFSDADEYGWVPGNWQDSNPEWVYIPSHYIWQPQGYVFVPGYWDWPLNKLSRIYYPIIIDPLNRNKIIYQPTVYIEPDKTIIFLFNKYPDYLCYFQHHYLYHENNWDNFLYTPAWWQIPAWWCFSWKNQWALWWWYTHPGYPQPNWITSDISDKIPSPRVLLIDEMKKVIPPLIVTSTGVISSTQLFDAIAEVDQKAHVPTENIDPILSSNQDILKDIMETATSKNKIQKENNLSPKGSFDSFKKISQKEIYTSLIVTSESSKIIIKDREVRRSLITPHLPKSPILKQVITKFSPTKKTEEPAVRIYEPPSALPKTSNKEK